MEDTPFDERFKNIEHNLNTFKSQITSLHNQLKLLDKRVKQEHTYSKNENVNVKFRNKKLTGFRKPSTVSIELSTFMNKPPEEYVSRTEATEFIMNYIKKHNLAKSTIIQLDKNLKTLFNIKNDERITYFNIHNYIDQHFIV